MDIHEIQKHLDGLVPRMAARGVKTPSAEFQLKSGERFSGSFHFCDETKPGRWGYEYFRGDSAEDVLARMSDWVEQLPSPEEARVLEFTKAVAAAANLGRELGVDGEFLNPVITAMKRISEATMVHQPSPAE